MNRPIGSPMRLASPRRVVVVSPGDLAESKVGQLQNGQIAVSGLLRVDLSQGSARTPIAGADPAGCSYSPGSWIGSCRGLPHPTIAQRASRTLASVTASAGPIWRLNLDALSARPERASEGSTNR